MYKMPVPIKDIKDGDIIIHNRVPMFVVEVYEKTLGVIDIYSGESKTIILSKSPFGFDFATKVVSIIDFGASSRRTQEYVSYLRRWFGPVDCDGWQDFTSRSAMHQLPMPMNVYFG